MEAEEKITGTAVYTDDMTLPGMLHAAVVGSDYAHARILSYNTDAAKALAGVKAVLTGEDIEMAPVGQMIKDETPLARGKVRYIGEPVVAIAAVDLEIARAAARLVEIEYEELEAVFDPEEALKADAPILHEQRADYSALFEMPEHRNAMSYTQYKEGDPDSAWDECDVIVEGVYETPAQEHMYMEPCSTISSYDRNGKVTIWSSQQSVFRVQALVAETLCMSMSKVRVISPKVGGGFGGKCDLTHQPISVLLSRATRRPVKYTLTREEDMMTTKSRHPCKMYLRTGAKSDGTLIAREGKYYLDSGAYADEGPEVATVAAFFARGPYRIPNINVESWSVYTNKLKASAFRGFGNPQASFGSESQLDEIAEKIGMDPIELRLKNALKTGEQWLGGQHVEVGSLGDCLVAAREQSNWDEKLKGIPAPPGKRRGIGVAGMAHISALMSSSAMVMLNEDGTATLNTGAVDIGAGQHTVLAQIAAGTLGLSLDQVNYGGPDTDTSPFDFQTSASRITYTCGKAVTEAAESVRELMFEKAAQMLECDEGDLELGVGGVIGMKGVPEAKLRFADIAGYSLFVEGGAIMATHSWKFPGEPFDPKRTLRSGFTFNAIGVFCFGAQIAEVEVDEASGKVEVLNFWAAHDVGRAINPGACDGQIHGAVAQGLGYALFEEMLWDDGRLANPSMMDYKIPGSMDVPYGIHPILIEQPEETGPFGAKGIGEVSLVGVAPAIVNAVRNATGGAAVKKIPATGERVLRAMLEKEAEEKGN